MEPWAQGAADAPDALTGHARAAAAAPRSSVAAALQEERRRRAAAGRAEGEALAKTKTAEDELAQIQAKLGGRRKVQEERVDPSDGRRYTLSSFWAVYGHDAPALWREAGRLMRQHSDPVARPVRHIISAPRPMQRALF